MVGRITCSQGQAGTRYECLGSSLDSRSSQQTFSPHVCESAQQPLQWERSSLHSLYFGRARYSCVLFYLPVSGVGARQADKGSLAPSPSFLPLSCVSCLFAAMLLSFVTSIICLSTLIFVFSEFIFVSSPTFLVSPFPFAHHPPTLRSSCLLSCSAETSLYLMKGTFLFFSWLTANWLYCRTSSYWSVYVRNGSKELGEMFSRRFILMPPPPALFILPAQSTPRRPESTFVFIDCFGVQCLPQNRCLGKTGSSTVTP